MRKGRNSLWIRKLRIVRVSGRVDESAKSLQFSRLVWMCSLDRFCGRLPTSRRGDKDV